MKCFLAGETKVGKKREAKNERYGFGGRKRLGKQNDATSAADMGGFRQGRFDDGFSGRCGAVVRWHHAPTCFRAIIVAQRGCKWGHGTAMLGPTCPHFGPGRGSCV